MFLVGPNLWVLMYVEPGDDLYLQKRLAFYQGWSESHSVVFNSLRPHGLTDHGILQTRILEWVALPFSRDRTEVSWISGKFFTIWATRGWCPENCKLAKTSLRDVFCFLKSFQQFINPSVGGKMALWYFKRIVITISFSF